MAVERRCVRACGVLIDAVQRLALPVHVAAAPDVRGRRVGAVYRQRKVRPRAGEQPGPPLQRPSTPFQDPPLPCASTPSLPLAELRAVGVRPFVWTHGRNPPLLCSAPLPGRPINPRPSPLLP